MILSDRDILQALRQKRISIEPWDEDLLQPASVDVRMHEELRVFRNYTCPAIDPSKPDPNLTEPVTASADTPFILHPGEFALASTLEMLTLSSDLVCRLEGKSSLARLGLVVHATAGFIDPGFCGQVTLELSNVAPLPIILIPGMRIGQLSFVRLTSAAARPYGSPGLGSKYQHQAGPTPSRVQPEE